MRLRFLQSITTGLAVACLTLSASAQLDTGGEQDRQNQRDQSQQRESAQQRLGSDSSQEQGLRIGTVDLKKVSEAYKKSEEKKSQTQGESQRARPGQDQSQARGQDQEGEDLQQPAQADRARPFGQQGQSDSGVDEQMLNKIREQARSVAQEEDVDMIVLEVLHEDGSDVETVDLTDRVIARLEQGDTQGQQSTDDQPEPLMGGQAEEQDSENADAEKAEKEEGEGGGLNW